MDFNSILILISGAIVACWMWFVKKNNNRPSKSIENQIEKSKEISEEVVTVTTESKSALEEILNDNHSKLQEDISQSVTDAEVTDIIVRVNDQLHVIRSGLPRPYNPDKVESTTTSSN